MARLPTPRLLLPQSASHDGAVLPSPGPTADTDFEASRLGGQFLWQALNAYDSYIFKFSTMPMSGSSNVAKTG